MNYTRITCYNGEIKNLDGIYFVLTCAAVHDLFATVQQFCLG